MEREPEAIALSPAAALARLKDEAAALLARPGRQVLGIAGGPGVGKSTLAQHLARDLAPVAAYVPMDGLFGR